MSFNSYWYFLNSKSIYVLLILYKLWRANITKPLTILNFTVIDGKTFSLIDLVESDQLANIEVSHHSKTIECHLTHWSYDTNHYVFWITNIGLITKTLTGHPNDNIVLYSHNKRGRRSAGEEVCQEIKVLTEVWSRIRVLPVEERECPAMAWFNVPVRGLCCCECAIGTMWLCY